MHLQYTVQCLVVSIQYLYNKQLQHLTLQKIIKYKVNESDSSSLSLNFNLHSQQHAISQLVHLATVTPSDKN